MRPLRLLGAAVLPVKKGVLSIGALALQDLHLNPCSVEDLPLFPGNFLQILASPAGCRGRHIFF